MTIEELRIGSLILREGKLVKIEEDDFNYLADEVNNDVVEAIPFTKEWFDKAQDFKFDSDSLHLALCEIDAANEYNFSDTKPPVYKYVLFVNGGLGDQESYGARIEIKEVHQLQNICFALTGEEIPLAL